MIGHSCKNMARLLFRRSAMRRVLFFSFHYPPDQSAGAVRTNALVHELVRQDLTSGHGVLQCPASLWCYG